MGTSRCEKCIDSPTKASKEARSLLTSGVDVDGGHEIIGSLFVDPCEWIGAPAKGTNMWIVKKVLPCARGLCHVPLSIALQQAS